MFAEIVKKQVDLLMSEYESQSNPGLESELDGLDTVKTVRKMFDLLISRLKLIDEFAGAARPLH